MPQLPHLRLQHSPPYLFDGAELAPRPGYTLTAAQKQIKYGQALSFNVASALPIQKVSLIKTGSVTHSFNFEQRYLELPFNATGDVLTVTMPSSPNLATPGFYMLFLVDVNGTPSTAEILHFKPQQAVDGDAVTFQSQNYPDYVIGALDGVNYGIIEKGDELDPSARFYVRQGLAGKGVSLESVQQPGYFLRHTGYEIKLMAKEDSALFALDASFTQEPGLANADCTSFRSVNYPEHLIRHRGYKLWIDPEAGDSLFKNDATFCPNKPVTAKAIRLHSLNYPGYLIGEQDGSDYGIIERGSPQRGSTEFFVRAGLAGQGISLESAEQPGYFLSHTGYRVQLKPLEDEDAFKASASFFQDAGLADDTCASFRPVSDPDRYMRHRYYQLWLDPSDPAPLYLNDATFCFEDLVTH